MFDVYLSQVFTYACAWYSTSEVTYKSNSFYLFYFYSLSYMNTHTVPSSYQVLTIIIEHFYIILAY